MNVDALYGVDQWILALIFLMLALAADEIGFHLGRAAGKRTPEVTKSQISTVQSGILAVLGLLLAFTMSMEVSRFETRKQLVLEESNAIGTAYLRAQLAPPPEGAEIASRLREYVVVRLEYSRADADPVSLLSTRARAARLQDEFWSRGVAFAQRDPRSVTAGLLLQSLNQVIDLESAWWVALANRVPAPVIYIVVVIAVLAEVLVGYVFGLGDRRNLVSTIMLASAITLVLVVILDLDRPRRGAIRVSQQALVDLQDRLNQH